MKRITFPISLATFFSIAISCTGNKGIQEDTTEHLARLEIDSVVDMGTFPSSSPVKTLDIDIANSGDTTLFLTAAVPECDCTTVEVTNSVLEPGERSAIRATLNLSEFIAPMTVEKRFAILCNSEHNRAIYVTLVGHLER